MKKALPFFTMFLLVIINHPLSAQQWKNDISYYFQEIRRGTHPPIPESVSAADLDRLKTLAPFLNDSSLLVRTKAYEMVFSISSRASDVVVRKQGVDILMQAFVNREMETMGIVLRFLTKYHRDDFTSSAKDSIRKLVGREAVYRKELVKIAAFLQLKDLTPLIREYSLSGNPSALRWAAIISLARMGDNDAVSKMMMRIRQLPVNDDVVYSVFPDLIFTRNPEAIAYTVDALQSDTKNCLSADAEKEVSIPCGYRIMEQLAPVIEGFPLALDISGDLRTDNYPEALNNVRKWFRENKQYMINDNQY